MLLAEIESRCAEYEAQSEGLELLIGDLEADLAEVKRKHIAKIKRQAGVLARLKAELISGIESSPNLFTKPKTLTVNGVKVGFASSVGKLVFEDEQQVLKLIRKHFPDREELLISKTEEPNKSTLKKLPAEDLARLQCEIEGEGDTVVVSRVAGDIEKLVGKLMEKMVEAMVKA